MAPAGLGDQADEVVAGGEVVEDVGAVAGGKGGAFAGVEAAVVVGVEVDGPAGEDGLVGFFVAVGVEVVPGESAEGGGEEEARLERFERERRRTLWARGEVRLRPLGRHESTIGGGE